METKVFKLFGKVLVTDKPKTSFSKMNEMTLKLGIFVPEQLCYQWLFAYLRVNIDVDYNSTFYKAWDDVTSKTRFELFIDQIKHYASTYGTNFQDEAWVPERTSELPEFPYKELKVLEGITEEELEVQVKKLAYSNIAMSTETLTMILEILTEMKISLEIEKIQNRELKLKAIPDDYNFQNGQECLLWILWKHFHISMLVKNKETFSCIIPDASMLPILNRNKKVLATVFYRNKDVFMQFKKCKELCHIVNVIRKFTTKLHKPMKESPWLRLEKMNYSERMNLFNSASIFKLIQMYNVLSNPTGYYVIRNGKAFYKESAVREINNSLLTELLEVIVSKIPKVESVALPKGIELAMPTSEKNFIGDIPLGSYINCAEKNTMIGIYWRNEWGARDLDLHVITISGRSVGWDSAFNIPGEVVFSGDMTNADPEATEIAWFKKKPVDSIVSVSEYNGGSKYSFKVFVAQETPTNFGRNYMVDPRNVIYEAGMNFENRRDVTLGYFKDDKFVFHSCNIGNGLVPSGWRQKILEHLVSCKFLTVRDVLEFAGITIFDDAEIKLSTKGELINFFSGPDN